MKTEAAKKTRRYLKVGDTVLWKGAWGTEPEKKVKVIDIEKTTGEHSKSGTTVKKVNWESTFVVTLDNDHWAYHYQLKPLTETK